MKTLLLLFLDKVLELAEWFLGEDEELKAYRKAVQPHDSKKEDSNGNRPAV